MLHNYITMHGAKYIKKANDKGKEKGIKIPR
jgi:hypothetical protein